MTSIRRCCKCYVVCSVKQGRAIFKLWDSSINYLEQSHMEPHLEGCWTRWRSQARMGAKLREWEWESRMTYRSTKVNFQLEGTGLIPKAVSVPVTVSLTNRANLTHCWVFTSSEPLSQHLGRKAALPPDGHFTTVTLLSLTFAKNMFTTELMWFKVRTSIICLDCISYCEGHLSGVCLSNMRTTSVYLH